MSYFGLEPAEGAEPVINFICSIGILSLIAILSLLNVFMYYTILYLITNYNVEIRFPRFKKIFNYYKSTTIFVIIIEFILGALCLLTIFISAVLLFKQML